MLIKLDVRSYYYTLAGSLCPDRGSRVRKSIPDQDWAVWRLVIGAGFPDGGLHQLCHMQWLCVPLLVASRGFVQEEGIEFSMGLTSEGSSLYILCCIISQLYMYVFSFELQSCCVAQGNLTFLGSRQPSCLSLQSHQDVRWGHHAWLRTVYKKAPFKDTYCTHLCIYRRPTCTYCVCDVWVCMRDTCVT